MTLANKLVLDGLVCFGLVNLFVICRQATHKIFGEWSFIRVKYFGCFTQNYVVRDDLEFI